MPAAGASVMSECGRVNANSPLRKSTFALYDTYIGRYDKYFNYFDRRGNSSIWFFGSFHVMYPVHNKRTLPFRLKRDLA